MPSSTVSIGILRVGKLCLHFISKAGLPKLLQQERRWLSLLQENFYFKTHAYFGSCSLHGRNQCLHRHASFGKSSLSRSRRDHRSPSRARALPAGPGEKRKLLIREPSFLAPALKKSLVAKLGFFCFAEKRRKRLIVGRPHLAHRLEHRRPISHPGSRLCKSSRPYRHGDKKSRPRNHPCRENNRGKPWE